MIYLILQISLAHGLDPALFHAILWQESSMRCQAVSATGDVGIGQISPATIKRYKFDKTRLRTDLRYSIEAAAMVLSDIKRMYGKREPKTWFTRYHSGNMVLRFRYQQAVKRWL